MIQINSVDRAVRHKRLFGTGVRMDWALQSPATTSAQDVDVLIIGAGPTGLALALWLTRLGVRPRIVDRSRGPGESSRAFLVQARTLEFYDQLGLAHEPITRGRKIETLTLHTRDAAYRLPFGDLGESLSPFPFLLVLRQDQHEKLLIDLLSRQGVAVERERQLMELTQDGPTVTARIRPVDGPDEIIRAAYVCGCDGAASSVRNLLGVDFEGEPHDQQFYVADIEARGTMADGEAHYAMAGDDLCSVFPLDRPGRVRLIGRVPAQAANRLMQIEFADVADAVRRDTRLDIVRVDWFASYPVREYIAAALSKGRVFLAGDAGHVHGPSGGQGLNAGIGDAVNLAWKLAAVLQGRALPQLLETYGFERTQAARQVGRLTRRGLTVQLGGGGLGRLARLELPLFAPGLLRLAPFRRAVFRTLSQLNINYRAGRSHSTAVAAGDRLPWVRAAQNFNSLRSMDWQVHVYGAAQASLVADCAQIGLAVRRFDWMPDMRGRGLVRNHAYLVRPDGYVAGTSPSQQAPALNAALARYSTTPRTRASATANASPI